MALDDYQMYGCHYGSLKRGFYSNYQRSFLADLCFVQIEINLRCASNIWILFILIENNLYFSNNINKI